MSICQHEEFDEYFGKCTDCGAEWQEVIAEQFKTELQQVYGKMQQALGIESGDIAPEQFVELEQKETALASVVSKWLEAGLEN